MTQEVATKVAVRPATTSFQQVVKTYGSPKTCAQSSVVVAAGTIIVRYLLTRMSTRHEIVFAEEKLDIP